MHHKQVRSWLVVSTSVGMSQKAELNGADFSVFDWQKHDPNFFICLGITFYTFGSFSKEHRMIHTTLPQPPSLCPQRFSDWPKVTQWPLVIYSFIYLSHRYPPLSCPTRLPKATYDWGRIRTQVCPILVCHSQPHWLWLTAATCVLSSRLIFCFAFLISQLSRLWRLLQCFQNLWVCTCRQTRLLGKPHSWQETAIH